MPTSRFGPTPRRCSATPVDGERPAVAARTASPRADVRRLAPARRQVGRHPASSTRFDESRPATPTSDMGMSPLAGIHDTQVSKAADDKATRPPARRPARDVEASVARDSGFPGDAEPALVLEAGRAIYDAQTMRPFPSSPSSRPGRVRREEDAARHAELLGGGESLRGPSSLTPDDVRARPFRRGAATSPSSSA